MIMFPAVYIGTHLDKAIEATSTDDVKKLPEGKEIHIQPLEQFMRDFISDAVSADKYTSAGPPSQPIQVVRLQSILIR